VLPDDLDVPDGAVAQQVEAHCQAHALPRDRRPTPRLVPGTLDVAPTDGRASATPGMWGKIRRWFGG
jgi:hypothetical protein